jgi:hypothetical protein
MHKRTPPPLLFFKFSWLWLLLEVSHNWLHLDLEKSPHLCSIFELSRVAECHLFLWEDGGHWPLRGGVLLNCLWIVWRFCQFGSSVPWYQSVPGKVWKVQKVRFCPTEEGDPNRSEVRANTTFLAKLSNKEIYKKALGMDSINLIACPIRDVLKPLNCCKVLIGNSHKVL